MSSSATRRSSFHAFTDKLPDRPASASRRYSDFSGKLEKFTESPETLGLSGTPKNRKPRDRMCSVGMNKLREIKTNSPQDSPQPKSAGEVKSILKKQSSLERIDYTYLLDILSSDSSSCLSDQKSDDSVFSAKTFPPTVTHRTRRVRFNDNVFFRFSESDEQYFEDAGSEDDYDSDCASLQTLCAWNVDRTILKDITQERNGKQDTKLPETIPRTTHGIAHSKKDTRVEPVTKHTRLSHCANLLQSKTAWVKNDPASLNEDPNVKQSSDRKVRDWSRSSARSLERSKTDIGMISYKDVQSKLRRMGCLDFKSSPKYRKQNAATRKTNYKEEHESCKDNTEIYGKWESRNNYKYSTIREELYDINDCNSSEDILSVRFANQTCRETGSRSLGDEYARFLKGRYKVDDITCT